MTHIKGDHFKIEVEVPKGKLEKFMLATVGPWHIEIKEYVENGAASSTKTPARGKKKGNGKRHKIGESLLTMTGKTPQEVDGLLSRGLARFEHMEADQGIGTITVQMLRTHLDDAGFEGRKLQTRLFHEGYLEYL
jgi:hypothetical protein